MRSKYIFLLLLVLLTLPTPAFTVDWFYIYTAREDFYFIDRDSIKKIDESIYNFNLKITRTSHKKVYLEKQGDPLALYDIVFVNKLDCKESTYTILSYSVYEDSGAPIFSEKFNKTYKTNTYGGPLRAVTKEICEGKDFAGRPPANTADDPHGKSYGTGFFVNKNGSILTNYHVIDRASKIEATYEGKSIPLSVKAVDQKKDLAILSSDAPHPHFIKFREGNPVRTGDSVIAAGYPLPTLLTDELRITDGTISAMSGLNNDPGKLQITAPIQPGNSGGPLLDTSGHLVGVIVSKISDQAVVSKVGVIPQNINFAINLSEVTSFLDQEHIEYESTESTEIQRLSNIADELKKTTVRISVN